MTAVLNIVFICPRGSSALLRSCSSSILSIMNFLIVNQLCNKRTYLKVLNIKSH